MIVSQPRPNLRVWLVVTKINCVVECEKGLLRKKYGFGSSPFSERLIRDNTCLRSRCN